MRIREYVDSDYPEVAQIWKRCFSKKIRPIDSRKILRRVVKHAPGLFLVAEDRGKLVGTVMATYDGRQVAIHRMAVLPEKQRKGIGKKLLEELMPRIERLKPTEVFLNSVPRRYVVRLYEKAGLKKQKVIPMRKRIY